MLYEIRNFCFHFSEIVEEEGVFVGYINDFKPHTSFAGLEKHVTVDAEDINNSILNAIKGLNHTDVSGKDYLKSVFSCLINLNADDTSIISGHISGIEVHMKEMFPGVLLLIVLSMSLNWQC